MAATGKKIRVYGLAKELKRDNKRSLKMRVVKEQM